MTDTSQRQPLTVFYSPTYWAGVPDFDTFRKSQWIEQRVGESAPDDSAGRPPPSGMRVTAPADTHDVELDAVHTAAYLGAVKSGEPATLATSNGFEWTPGLYRAAECSSQGAAQAAVMAFNTGRAAGSLSAGLHHARGDRGAGFCTFNGLALAARGAIQAGAHRILVLDLDAHFGGGTWSIVSTWEQVWQADVSVNDFDRYDASGHPRVVVERVASARDYLDTVARVLDELPGRLRGTRPTSEPGPPRATSGGGTRPTSEPGPPRATSGGGTRPASEPGLPHAASGGTRPASATARFDLVIYNAGMDPFEGCVVGGLRGITHATLESRERLVFDWARAEGIPVAFVLAGGYTGSTLSREVLVDLHLLTIDAAR